MVLRRETIRNDTDHDVVGHEQPLRHEALRLAAERRPGAPGIAQNVAGGDVRHPAPLLQQLRLRALARPRRSHDHGPYSH